jgi:hypothetical protein
MPGLPRVLRASSAHSGRRALPAGRYAMAGPAGRTTRLLVAVIMLGFLNIKREGAMSELSVQRFEAEFAPRIAWTIVSLYGQRIKAGILPQDHAGNPTRIRLYGDAIAPLRRFSHDLNAYLSWDSGEIAALLEPEGEPKFARYLAALGEKIAAWQEPREIDFSSRSQAQNTVVIGGLDFES